MEKPFDKVFTLGLDGIFNCMCHFEWLSEYGLEPDDLNTENLPRPIVKRLEDVCERHGFGRNLIFKSGGRRVEYSKEFYWCRAQGVNLTKERYR